MAEETKTEKKPTKKKSKKKEKPPEEKVYTIPLGKSSKGARGDRVRNAVKILKKFLTEKLGLEEYTIEEDLNHLLWAKGAKKPPRSVKIKVVKSEEGVIVTTTGK